MLLTLYTCLLLLMTSGLGTVQAQDIHEDNEDMSINSPYQKLAPNNIDFAFNLFQYLQSVAPDENIIFSPISVSMALSMLALGADSQTGTQILQGSGFNHSEIPDSEIHQSFQELYHLLGQSDDNSEMNMGNALFFKQSLKLLDLYSEDLQHYYGLEKVPIDFKNWAKGSNQINEYIKSKTQGKISDLLSDLKDPALLTLVNYISFTGTWKLPFHPDDTTEGDFFKKDDSVVKVPMMYQANNFNFLFDPLLGCISVMLDYVGNSTFYFILPDVKDIDNVIQALSQDALQRWSESVITRPLGLYIPRLSLSGTYDLGDIMKAMDIVDLKKKQTDLSSITGNAKRKLSKVLHKAKLEISEQGLQQETPTESAGPNVANTKSVRVDRPFLFMVLDNVSQSILFLGKVMTPF
ncbi:corticosteroid-binding globulin-like [Sorex araneus]|uniref:corticosteroid-binding globulin-like n=1 Tax=Sorex araneus TaxID=42254 RepID=UPI002433710E|nr:corticosteroid-binding globulin-like [Sorex araneus]